MSPLDATTVRGLTREALVARIIHLAGEQQIAAAGLAALDTGAADDAPNLVTRDEAATLLRISPRTVEHRKDSEPVASFRVKVGRRTLYDAAKITAYIRDPAGYLSRLAGPESSRPAAAPRPAPFLAASGRGRAAR